MKRLIVPTLALMLAARAFAGDPPVDVTQYFPLGVFNQWQIVNEVDETDTTHIKVVKVALVDGVLQYTVTTPFFDTAEKVRLVMGVDQGEWFLYRVGLTADSISDLDPVAVTLDPPVLLGTTSETLGTQHGTDVDAPFSIKVKIGPFSKKFDMRMTGSIESRFDPASGGLDTPAGSFDASELLDWNLLFDLNVASDDSAFDFDENVLVDGHMLVANGLGYVLGTDPNSQNHLLQAAILPGTLIGDGFTDPGTVLTGAAFPTPGLFTLDGQTADASEGGEFVLSDATLEQMLSGKVLLTGTLAPAGADDVGVPIELKGSCKINTKTGIGKLVLKGKTKELTEKPLVLKVKQEVTADTTSIVIAYKSGKDVLGEMTLGVMPFPAESVELAFNTLVDKSFKPFKSKRKLGAEGHLFMNPPASFVDGALPKDFAVTLHESRKIKEGQADKHSYVMTQTGLTTRLMVASAFSTSSADFLLAKFKAKLLGLKIKPTEIGDVVTSSEDATLD